MYICGIGHTVAHLPCFQETPVHYIYLFQSGLPSEKRTIFVYSVYAVPVPTYYNFFDLAPLLHFLRGKEIFPFKKENKFSSILSQFLGLT